MDRPTLHLISGLPGVGKTTYARGLSVDSNTVVFSLDRWLITAYGRYTLSTVGQTEHTRRVRACRDLIWDSASELLRRATDVVLDDGFFLRDHRIRYSSLAAALGAKTRIHHVVAPLDVVRLRLERRNQALPPYNFRIDPDVLVGFQGIYEAPSDDEGAELVVVTTGHERTTLDCH
jgi:hypothetical protein